LNYAHSQGGETIAIHYGVESGLWQLGLDGQLMTGVAGSRCRISIITTNALIAREHPVDLGVEKVCDECRACVRQGPVGAMRSHRSEHRGVVKAKIKMERCFPTMVQTHGCAICMKVCPVQRYGLPAVHEHFAKTGTILGARTDELEGFVWPPDGRYYDATSKPRIDSARFLHPPGLKFDASREAAPNLDPEDTTVEHAEF
jgi:epoxyqueuosine reductase